MPKSKKTLKNILILTAIAVFAIAIFIPLKISKAKDINLTVIANDKNYNFYSEEIGRYNGKLYLKKASQIVDGIYLDTVKREKDAKITFLPNTEEVFNIKGEVLGYEIDKTQLLYDIENALNNGKTKVYAEINEIKPKITKSELIKETNLRASFTTYYSSSPQNRKENIKLASSKINGTILSENEEFSFNEIVGVRNEENGFLPAKIIYNGDFVEGVGGGVCQVSTTLYNASLLCGLKITEHHPHSLSVSYVEPSFDAMVNSYSSDLKFVNNTGGRLYIKSVADDNRIKISFYGLKQLETYERVSVKREETPYLEYLYEDDESLPIGSQITVREPKESLKSEGYLIKYVNGERVANVKIRSDSYSGVKGLIKIGKSKQP
ncbi:MAG: VanW family protein [Clostridia bacterium]|nr:VanW family protein [Clostridia bacterium]